MSDLHVDGTSTYATTTDSFTSKVAGNTVVPADQNGPAQAIINIETELGTNPSGTAADITVMYR